MKAVQCRLHSDTQELTCWLDRTDLKVGNIVSLKQFPGVMWHVAFVSEPKEKDDIMTGWKVGGIPARRHN